MWCTATGGWEDASVGLAHGPGNRAGAELTMPCCLHMEILRIKGRLQILPFDKVSLHDSKA